MSSEHLCLFQPFVYYEADSVQHNDPDLFVHTPAMTQSPKLSSGIGRDRQDAAATKRSCAAAAIHLNTYIAKPDVVSFPSKNYIKLVILGVFDPFPFLSSRPRTRSVTAFFTVCVRLRSDRLMRRSCKAADAYILKHGNMGKVDNEGCCCLASATRSEVHMV